MTEAVPFEVTVSVIESAAGFTAAGAAPEGVAQQVIAVCRTVLVTVSSAMTEAPQQLLHFITTNTEDGAGAAATDVGATAEADDEAAAEAGATAAEDEDNEGAAAEAGATATEEEDGAASAEAGATAAEVEFTAGAATEGDSMTASVGRMSESLRLLVHFFFVIPATAVAVAVAKAVAVAVFTTAAC